MLTLLWFRSALERGGGGSDCCSNCSPVAGGKRGATKKIINEKSKDFLALQAGGERSDPQTQLISLPSSWTSLKTHPWGEVRDPKPLFSLSPSASFLSPFLSPPSHRGTQPTIGASQWKNSVSSPSPMGRSGNNIHYSPERASRQRPQRLQPNRLSKSASQPLHSRTPRLNHNSCRH